VGCGRRRKEKLVREGSMRERICFGVVSQWRTIRLNASVSWFASLETDASLISNKALMHEDTSFLI
jgi:hypothetical protein